MMVSNSEYERAKRWFEIFDDMASHIAEGLERDFLDKNTKIAVQNAINMRDSMQVTVRAYEEMSLNDL